MSAENVELVRRLYAAFKAGDNVWPFEVYDAEIEWDISAVPWGLELGFEPIYRGHDGVRAFWRHWLDAWESIEFRVEEVIDAGDEVVAFYSLVNRGRASGAEVAGAYAQIWTVRNRKVVRLRLFADRAEALRAVGRS
jgi:ketosteroid isomerase-like protein